MADSRLTALAALTGANLATGDEFEVTDISDTSMDATGTSKNMTASELGIGLAGLVAHGEDRSVTSDVTMTTAGTFYDGATKSLTAGTYHVWAKVSVVAVSTANHGFTFKLWDGASTIYDQAEMTTTGTAQALSATVTLFAEIPLASTTTIKASVTSTVNGDKIRAASWKGNAIMWRRVA